MTQIDHMHTPDLSVVVPAYNEAENVENLAAEISAALAGIAHEMIFIDDASTDDTKSVLINMKTRFPHLRVLSHRQNSGQSRGVRSGILAARAPIIATSIVTVKMTQQIFQNYSRN